MTRPAEDKAGRETQAVLTELNRVKVLFQARAIAAVMGFPPPNPAPSPPEG